MSDPDVPKSALELVMERLRKKDAESGVEANMSLRSVAAASYRFNGGRCNNRKIVFSSPGKLVLTCETYPRLIHGPTAIAIVR